MDYYIDDTAATATTGDLFIQTIDDGINRVSRALAGIQTAGEIIDVCFRDKVWLGLGINAYIDGVLVATTEDTAKEQYRIEVGGNVNMNGKRTSYTVHEYHDVHNAYVYNGNYFAPGFDRTEEQCLAHYNRTTNDIEG